MLNIMGYARLSETSYRKVESAAAAAGSATHEGEKRQREGKGLHDLVNPAGYGVIRVSKSWLEPSGKKFVLLNGTAMLVEDLLDTTGSMRGNVAIAMKSLLRKYKLLTEGPRAVLRRYDPQVISSIFGDMVDQYILQRSMAEMDEKIAKQMACMYPEGGGDDAEEDPDYGLFGAAYLSWCTAQMLGLKTYHFTVTDAPGRGRIDNQNLVRVFGNEVYDKVAENAQALGAKWNVKKGDLPDTKQIVKDLLERTHAFVLQVNDHDTTSRFWTRLYGEKRVIKLPNTELLPEVQAAIIGLTEGTLDLQTLDQFLREDARLSAADSKRVQAAVMNMPLRAQAKLPNFKKLPLKGDLYETKASLWPVGRDDDGNVVATSDEGGKRKKAWI